jgi:predicted acyl esterase
MTASRPCAVGILAAAVLGSAGIVHAQKRPAQPSAAAETAAFEILPRENVMVAMRDGTHLATDIYFPAMNGAPVEGKFPVILMRTPYGKTLEAGTVSRWFVPSGYIVVIQDVRGRYKSEGHWFPIRDDPNDGFDTAKWIGAQPWSTRASARSALLRGARPSMRSRSPGPRT